MRDGKWEYTVRFYGLSHSLVMETVHANETSRNIEVSAAKARLNRGDLSHIEVISHVDPYDTQKIYGDAR